MASEAELKVVFDIFKHDQGLVLEATRALAWAKERAGVTLTDDEIHRFSFALAAESTTLESGFRLAAAIQCASKGCGGGGDNAGDGDGNG